MKKNYYKQVVAFSNAPKEVVYKYDKCERLERCFCVNFKISTPQLSSVVLREGKAPIITWVKWTIHNTT